MAEEKGVRRRGQKKKKDARDQRIQDMIEELSTTMKYPTHKLDPVQTPFGEFGGGEVFLDTLLGSGETRGVYPRREGWAGINQREPVPFDPVRRVPEITRSGRGRNIFNMPLRGRAALDPEQRVMDNPIPPAKWDRGETQRKRPRSPIEGFRIEDINNSLNVKRRK